MSETAYTSFILKDEIKNHKDFLKLCLRQFGVYSEYRDEPLSVEMPDINKEYEHQIKIYEKEIAEITDEYNKFKSLTKDEIKSMFLKTYNDKIASAKKNIKYNIKRNEKLEKILLPLLNYKSNISNEFKNILDFAINQIEITKSDDSLFQWYESEIKNYQEKINNIDEKIDDYIEEKNKTFEDDIAYFEKIILREKDAYERNNKFINDFLSELDKL